MILYAAGAVLIAAVKRVVRIIGYLPKGAAAVFWVVFILPLPSQAHEFWIEPSSFQPDPDQSLTADLLITDLSGIALEYAFGTERPVIFIDLPLKIKNPNYKDLKVDPFELSIRSEIGKIVPPDNIDDIDKIASELINNQSKSKNKIRMLREKYVLNFGNSSEIAAQTILDSMK